jgi:hypothetical protein
MGKGRENTTVLLCLFLYTLRRLFSCVTRNPAEYRKTARVKPLLFKKGSVPHFCFNLLNYLLQLRLHYFRVKRVGKHLYV